MTLEIYSLIAILGLCWGSFLNVVAYRLVFDKPFFKPRSECPTCNKKIAWYDNIPVLSWIILLGKCRLCKKPISSIYPIIELVTAICMVELAYHSATNPYQKTLAIFISQSSYQSLFFPYFIFFSALILALASDLFAMVIPQIFTLWMIPIGIIFSYLKLIPLTVHESIVGALSGYGILLITELIFKQITKKEGIGVGDMELLAFIGSFTGPMGAWISLLVATITGIFCGGGYLLISKQSKNTRIPFAPFLACGAIFYVLYKEILLSLFVF